ncbi:hypothetical protein TSTA_110360 [Talaromyces stipitatus ATCC 10500]|uniref:Nephrocystin 3-like N-terminal domain-containing protein n=1 Tax=Talaromyces stipitatus (strain ATCC 10500 / CBS 375.48 / QM 6759 / NRRL 1006) TaxID=441959 RepID=B8MUT6_TALSN|nr:uncharacterized protein TSTA_110360 [Talaromyces stipitatus ATCC 10500]EED11856.1 hypothetical protein TSTA_110360 [Talaromyces stipitatus ATCC 10500]
MAAVYAKDLSRIPPNKVEAEKRINDITSSEYKDVHNVAQKTNATIEILDTCSDRRRKELIAQLLYAKGSTSESFHKDGKLGASLFFKRGEADRGSVAFLLEKIPLLITHIELATDADLNLFNKAMGEQFEKLICQPLSQIPHQLPTVSQLIVIDALDECVQDGDTLLRLLSEKREQQIRSGFKDVPEEVLNHMELHEIAQSIIRRDINTFLEYRFAQVQEKYAKDGRPLPSGWPG